MKLSFVIPAYNEEHYLDLCLGALMPLLKGRDAEVIVVDNNSNDRTSEVAMKYPGVTLLHEPRRGANMARQTGFQASRGELIAFLDADVKIGPGWIERAEKEFARNKKLVCLSGPFILYDLPRGVQVLAKVYYVLAYLLYVLTSSIFGTASVIQGGNYIVRREALIAVSGLNTDLTFYGDDADLAKRLKNVGLVKFSLGFPILASGRRLAKEGMLTMAVRYGMNYFWIVLFNRPFTMTSKEIRPKNGEIVYQPENKKSEGIIAVVVIGITVLVVLGIGYGLYAAAESSAFSVANFIELKADAEAKYDEIKTKVTGSFHYEENVLKGSSLGQ